MSCTPASRWREQAFKDYAQPALEWLQRQNAPIIFAPEHRVGVPVRIAVPNNDLDVAASVWARRQEPKKQPDELKTMKTVRSTRPMGNKDDQATVHYLFLPADGGCPQLEALTTASRSITHLAWRIAMADANAVML